MRLFNFCNKVIEYSFYLLFFLIPLAFTSDTSELFEFNKLWLTFGITIVIALAWITKMVIRKELRIQRTPLDIPIVLFLISEIISSFLSLDMHVSLWGYYSRFNGGLFSILAYVFLYYAFVTNLRDEVKEEKSKFEFKKVYLFLAAIAVFIIGVLVSSQIKNPDLAGIPYQALSTLLTIFASFAVFMLAAPKGIVRRSLYAILASALLVILWGLPSHFGYDPTCLLFRGTFDVSCWTDAFQPKVRIFSTLGQPDWMGAYLAALLPLIAALFINSFKDVKLTFDKTFTFIKNYPFWLGLSLFVFFVAAYIALLYTQSRSAILAVWAAIPVFLILYAWFYFKPKFDKKNLTLEFKVAVVIFLCVGLVPFLVEQPFPQLERFTFVRIIQQITAKPAAPATKTVTKTVAPTPPPSPVSNGEFGGTDSSKIRLLVWRGAIDIWLHNPIFGSGLETYAFAYYQYRPAAHNMTSEAKYLYNKAHNEYLNYLATTGTVGIVTYLLMIGAFLFISLKTLFKRRKNLTGADFVVFSLLTGYGTILVTNFFGFSVVMVNILFYLFPAFVFLLLGKINYGKSFSLSLAKKENYDLSIIQKGLIVVLILIFGYLLYTLINYWNADRYYYYGYNYDQARDYQKAYPFLSQATAERPDEPTFLDEYAYNNAVLGASILAQEAQQPTQQNSQNTQIAKQLIDAAIADTDKVTLEHPNDIVFWKTKVRIFYTLSQANPQYLPMTLAAVKKAAQLAPTDADVSYNLGVLYGQNGDSKDAVATLQNTILLKRDYNQAYYALGIFYHQLAINAKGQVVNEAYNQKAIAEMNLLIKYFGPNQQASDAIKAWAK